MSSGERAPSEETPRKATSRRDFLRMAGATAAAAGGTSLLGTSPAAAEDAGPAVALEVVDYVDGCYVLSARPALAGTAGAKGTGLRLRDGLKVEIRAGQAQV